MNWRSFTLLITFMILGVTILPKSAFAQQNPTQNLPANPALNYNVVTGLKQKFGLAPQDYILNIDPKGMVLLSFYRNAPPDQVLGSYLYSIPGVTQVVVLPMNPQMTPATMAVPQQVAAQAPVQPAPASYRQYSPEQLSNIATNAAPSPVAAVPVPQEEKDYTTVFLPQRVLFEGPIADPRQPRFYASVRQYDIPTLISEKEKPKLAAVGIGDELPLIGRRFSGSAVQLGLQAMVTGQFNLDAESYDMISNDFFVGLPISFKYGNFDARLRAYHESSHLGDEYIENTGATRTDFDFEAVDLLLSYYFNKWRIYGGGGYILTPSPETLENLMFQGGLEYHLSGTLLSASPFAAMDITAWEAFDYTPSYSAKLGLEFAKRKGFSHKLRLLLEAYQGYSPHRQFYDQEITYLGGGIELSY